MRCMLVCDSESLTIHACLLIHTDSLFRFLSVNVALLGFTVLSALEVELGLVHEYLCYGVRVVLPSYLQS